MKKVFHKIKLIFEDRNLRKKVLFTLGALLTYRFLANIPLPGIDTAQLAALLERSELLGLFNVLSGGGLSQMSIIMLGVTPFITASIIMQLMTIMSPKIKAMHQDEGEAGRKKMAQFSRYLTVPLAVIQGFGFIGLLQSQQVLGDLARFDFALILIIAVAGSMLLTWIGELMTEYGVGNGVSLIIFAGIVAALPSQVARFVVSYDPSQLAVYIIGILIAIFVTYAIVVINEAERPVPITYAKQARGMKSYGGQSTYLPIRLNQAGVIPIIFAISIILFPQMVLTFATQLDIPQIQNVANWLLTVMQNQWIYAGIYFLLVFFFTYFYTAVTFDPEKIAENLQKGGAFIPGVRPGASTVKFLGDMTTRLTLFGATFLGLIAVLPNIMQVLTGNQSLAIGGAALLIVVSVIVDLLKKLDAQVSMREY
jgi:preprotein translocase subunit SecY